MKKIYASESTATAISIQSDDVTLDFNGFNGNIGVYGFQGVIAFCKDSHHNLSVLPNPPELNGGGHL